MSLVSTYVRADNGKMYRNPVLRGEGWFVCFDDDEPVEIVIADETGIKEPNAFLRSMGIKPHRMGKAMKGGSRSFEGGFKPAKSWFFEITHPIPAKLITSHDGIVERDEIFQGVIYDPV